MDARLILLGLWFAASSALAFDHSHAAWQVLLKKHVVVLEAGKASQLRYAGMAQDREPLRALRSCSQKTPMIRNSLRKARLRSLSWNTIGR